MVPLKNEHEMLKRGVSGLKKLTSFYLYVMENAIILITKIVFYTNRNGNNKMSELGGI